MKRALLIVSIVFIMSANALPSLLHIKQMGSIWYNAFNSEKVWTTSQYLDHHNLTFPHYKHAETQSDKTRDQTATLPKGQVISNFFSYAGVIIPTLSGCNVGTVTMVDYQNKVILSLPVCHKNFALKAAAVGLVGYAAYRQWLK